MNAAVTSAREDSPLDDAAENSPPWEPLAADEQAQFHEQGYLLLKSVVPCDEVASLLAEVARLVRAAQDKGSTFHEDYYHEGSFKLIRILSLTDAFDYLIDHPAYFGKVVGLMGPYIQMMSSEIFVRGAADAAITGFHTDLGPGLQPFVPHRPDAHLQIKMQLFLTDLSQPDSSNFALVPGSHRRPVEDRNPLCEITPLNDAIAADGTLPPEALQICCEPGDLLLFPHTLWHAVAPNRVGRTRFSLSLRYGQLALRPLERFAPILANANRALSERQRRLLGDLGDRASAYRPADQERIIFAPY